MRFWLSVALLSCVKLAMAQTADESARKLIAEYERDLRPLEIEVNRRWWDANVTGSDEAFRAKEEAETRLDLALADRQRFARLRACREARPSTPLLARQIELLYLQALPKQVDPDLLRRMVARANAIEQQFNAYRARVGDEQLTDSQVRKVLKESQDSARRRAVWEASKRVGERVASDLLALVEMRNQAARELGFADYHAMQLQLSEQDQADLVRLFDELDQLTREPFSQLKQELDRHLASQYGIDTAELRPWHYQDPFFQEAPWLGGANLDAVYAQQDLLELCRRFYAGIGLPIDEVLQASDLYEKPGKSPHAFCTDIDREGDVRVLANIVPNEYWMSTMLHELGHAVYSSRYIPRSLPYLLRTDAHTLCTEGVAMMFERFAKSADWLALMGVEVEDPAAFNRAGAAMRRQRLLIFSRWCQVMFRFEKELYRDPSQDLNALWWRLVEQYQLVRRPEGRNAPDYASKIHIVSAPCYYHNYMLGELFACQLHAAIAREVLHSDSPATAVYAANPAVGEFMRQRVFAAGRTLRWDELTRHATGAPLSAQAFAAEFRTAP
jgi:peptidyl-dipeptidase A